MQMHNVSLASRREEEEVKQAAGAAAADPECKCVCSSGEPSAGGEGGRGVAADHPHRAARAGPPSLRPPSHGPAPPELCLQGTFTSAAATPGRFVKFPGLAPCPDSLTSARPGSELGLGQGGGAQHRGSLVATETLLFPPWGHRGFRGGDGGGRGRCGVKASGVWALSSWGSLGTRGTREWEQREHPPPPTFPMECRARGWEP